MSRSVQELAWWWWEVQSPVTERRMMQPWGENSAAVYGVARGGSYVSFVPSLFTVDFITNVQTWAGCHLNVTLPWSPPRHL